MKKLIIIGAGNHAKVVLDIVRTINEYQVVGFAADGFPIYGSYILDEQTGTYRKVLSGYTLKEGTRGSIVEIYLLDPFLL